MTNEIKAPDALRNLKPGGGWTCKGTDGSDWTIEWDATTADPKPSKAEIQAEIDRLQAEYDNKQYQRNRRKEYPAYGAQFDYIYHHGVAKWKTDMIDPVKNKYPKP